MDTPVIKVTTDYSKFKTLLFNRAVVLPYVENLVDSINNRDLTMFKPIIVNEKMEIIDGQHTFEALKKTKKPVHYLVAKGAGITDVVILNSVAQKWSLTDYLNSFIQQGFGEYKKLKDFAIKNKLTISNAMALLTIYGKDGEKLNSVILRFARTEFKKGKFKITSAADGQELADYVNALARYCDDQAYRDRAFIDAVYSIWRKGEIEVNELIEKVKGYRQPLYRRANVRDYLRQFEDVYNSGLTKSKVRLY